ncbi:amino acid permease [Paractinoplanes globisporus]|uniref:Amino acid permease n=1 Tax=Paractinoplanes globisporus TaxID=113565 RepID=A0ABW6WJ09_9ACTN|nr:amino acid permease [Actinoplanes globisporus]
MLGTLAASVVYLLSMVAVFGSVPTTELAKDENKASYSVAADVMVGGGSWAGKLVAIAVIISGIGTLNGWIMIGAEMPLAAAHDGLFPAAFGRLSSRGVPAVGIIASAVLGSIAMAVSFMGTSGAAVFNRRELHTARFARDVIVAGVSLIFSVLFIWYSRNTGQDNWYQVWGPFLLAGFAMLIGIPVYLHMRTRMTEPPLVQVVLGNLVVFVVVWLANMGSGVPVGRSVMPRRG